MCAGIGFITSFRIFIVYYYLCIPQKRCISACRLHESRRHVRRAIDRARPKNLSLLCCMQFMHNIDNRSRYIFCAQLCWDSQYVSAGMGRILRQECIFSSPIWWILNRPTHFVRCEYFILLTGYTSNQPALTHRHYEYNDKRRKRCNICYSFSAISQSLSK